MKKKRGKREGGRGKRRKKEEKGRKRGKNGKKRTGFICTFLLFLSFECLC